MSPTRPTKTSALKQKTSEKIQKTTWSALALSVAIHGSILLTVGGYVIYEKIIPRTPFLDTGTTINNGLDETVLPPVDAIEEAPDSPQVTSDISSSPASGDEGAAATPSDILVSTAINQQFTLPPAIGAPMTNLSVLSNGSGSGQKGQGTGGGGKGVGPGGLRVPTSLFGSRSGGNETLTGHFYDLKQDPKGNETDMGLNAPGSHDDKNNMFANNVAAFVQTWDENFLLKFFRAKDTLNTTQVFIPIMDANEAPKAFDVERKVAPNRWLIHYKGTYTPPKSGTFCFAGVGDDILLVRFDNALALNGSVYGIPGLNEAYRENVGVFKIGDLVRNIRAGQWIRMRAGKSYPIEIIIGEIPGGQFAQFLTIIEEKKRYKQRPNNAGLLIPVFQTVPTKLPKFDPEGNAPSILTDPSIVEDAE
ncbi:MAG: hypothetical protein SFU85_03355 [Candidatus Methylacidiphilales bacterium]|nr:hypothetical protein [Candidatus Methylacidiphilales bacterium]